MYKFLFLFLCFFCIEFVATAQNQRKLDSLNKVYNSDVHDTVKVSALLNIAITYGRNQNDSMIFYVNSAFKLAEQIKFQLGLSISDELRADWFYYRNIYDSALILYNKRLNFIEKYDNNLKTKATVYREIAFIYRDKANYAKALEYYQKQLMISERLEDKNTVASIYNNMGIIYKRQKDYYRAIEYYNKSLNFATKAKIEPLMAANLVNIGAVFFEKKMYDSALWYQYKALEINNRIAPKKRLANNYHDIAQTLAESGNREKALDFFNKSIHLKKEIYDKLGIANSFLEIAKIHLAQNKMNESLNKCWKVAKVFEELNTPQEQIEVRMVLVKIYKKLNQPDSALYYFEQAKIINDSLFTIEKSKAISNLTSTMELERKQKELAIVEKDNKLNKLEAESKQRQLEILEKQAQADRLFALAREEKDQRKADSLKNVAQKVQLEADNLRINEEKILAENKAKSLLIVHAQKEKERQQIISGLMLLGLFAVILFALYVWRSRKKVADKNNQLALKNSEINQQKEEIEQQADHLKEALDKLKALEHFKESMTGMLVHDLKNPLNTVLGLAEMETDAFLKNNIKQAGKQMLNMVSNILDIQKLEDANMQIHFSPLHFFPIGKESLLHISFLAEDKKLTLKNNIPKNIFVHSEQDILIRILENLLTNAVKYTPMKGFIELGAEYLGDDNVKIWVKDSGKGIPADKLSMVFDKFSQIEAKNLGQTKSTGLGLTFCKTAVEAHGGNIGVSSELGKGATFYFVINGFIDETIKENETAEVLDFALQTYIISAQEQEKQMLLSQKLKKYQLYEGSEILAILDAFCAENTLSKPFLAWVEDIKSAVYNYDEAFFNELIFK